MLLLKGERERLRWQEGEKPGKGGREREGGREGARRRAAGRDFSIDDGDPCHPSLDIITAAGGLAMGHHDNDGHVWILRY